MSLNPKSRRRFLQGVAAAASSVLGLLPVVGGPEEILVLVTRRESAISEISDHDLKRIYLGDLSSVRGETVKPFNLSPNSAERLRFERDVLKMTPDQVAKYWIDRRIRGQSGAPKAVPNSDVAVKIAANFPGALVYIPVAFLNNTVKAIAINGSRHTDPGYLLGRR